MSLTTLDGRYQVIDRVAAGGMGEVFRARDAVLAREVAIKVLHRNLSGDPGFIDRFRDEARSAALLNHPNIVGVYDWDATDGVYFMVMEYVVGRNLREILHNHGRLAPTQATNVLLQTLAALEHAHQQGIVHRDVKPENVMLTERGIVKVADFGLARAYAGSTITQSGTVTGTVQYLAPEQIQGEPADPRTDLYALGVVGYELLTGEVPYTGETSLAIAYRHLSERVPPPSEAVPEVPQALDRIVLTATEKDRERRFPTATEMGRALAVEAKKLPPAPSLTELVGSLPGEEKPSEPGPSRATTVTIPRTLSPRVRRRRRRRRVAILLAVLLALAGAGWAAWTYAVPRYTDVPAVLDLPGDEAQAMLEEAGLEVRFGPAVFSVDVETGSVVRAEPPPGARVEQGTPITLRLSKGPPPVEVPDLSGLNLSQARRALKEAGLVLGDVEEAFHDTVPEGEIFEQSPRPRPGRTVDAGSEVNVTRSLGPPPVTIPQDLLGRVARDARTMLEGLGFRVERVENFSDDVARGNVIALRPRPGTEQPRGSTVTMVVSRGPRTLPMPDVLGKSQAAAVEQLQALGLRVRVRDLGLTGPNDGLVLASQPNAGATVEHGQTVTISVG